MSGEQQRARAFCYPDVCLGKASVSYDITKRAGARSFSKVVFLITKRTVVQAVWQTISADQLDIKLLSYVCYLL